MAIRCEPGLVIRHHALVTIMDISTRWHVPWANNSSRATTQVPVGTLRAKCRDRLPDLLSITRKRYRGPSMPAAVGLGNALRSVSSQENLLTADHSERRISRLIVREDRTALRHHIRVRVGSGSALGAPTSDMRQR
jgi:hypothetical protein